MNKETEAFIRQHAGDDVRQVALQGVKNPAVDLTFALEQIAGRQTAQRKLPSWAATEGIVYPPHLSMEQCSSEPTARYKQQVVHGLLPVCTSLVDLTGGFGVDFSFMAQGAQRAVYVEREAHLCAIAKENFQLLGLEQAEVVCADGADYLEQMEPASIVYLDPARRDSHGGRTYGIGDCTPDVLALRDLLLLKSSYVLLKLSPMLDWRKAVSDLGEQYVREVHIVSVHNECKELLIFLEGRGKRGEVRDYTVCCTNLLNDGSVQRFNYSLTSHLSPLSSLLSPLTSHNLYEPNASIMKAGCFTELSQRFGIAPIAQNSHLFVAADRIDSFPGRIFRIDAVTSLNKRELKRHLQGLVQANITVRNFPLSVAELRKRLKLSEGGSTYIFATTLADGDKVLLICSRT